MDTRVEHRGQRVALVAASLLLVTTAFVLAKTGRDALYFQGRGFFDLPKALMGMALLSPVPAVSVVWLLHTLGPRLTRLLLPVLGALLMVACHGLARPGGGLLMTLQFMSIPLTFGVLFSVSWLLAADLLDGVEWSFLGRAYGIIGAASIAGGVLGGLLANFLAMHIDPARFFLLAAAGLVVAVGIMGAAQHRFPPRMRPADRTAGAPSLADARVVLRMRYGVLLLLSAMVASLVGIFVEFQFYLAAAASGQGGRENAEFFARFYLLLNGIALFLQIYAMPRVQAKLGVGGSLLVLPLALAGGSATLVANASLVARAALRVAEGGLKSSIHRASWEQAYLLLTPAQRVVAKLAIDGMGARVAEGIGATVLFLWLRSIGGEMSLAEADIGWVTVVLVVGTLTWVLLARMLRAQLCLAGSDDRVDDYVAIPLPDT